MMKDLKDWLKANADIRFGLILLFIAVSTGHVGRLFADRETSELWFIGYILAVGVDGTLIISLYQFTNSVGRSKWAALAVFVSACLISGGFNIAYYRLNYPSDHWLISVGLGISAFGLAAALGMLKAMGDVKKQERQDQLEIEKFRMSEETKRIIAIEREKTRRAKPMQKKRKGLTVNKRRESVYAALLQDLGQSPADLGKHFGVSAQTIRNDFKALAELGKINYKDGRVTLRPQAVARAGEG